MGTHQLLNSTKDPTRPYTRLEDFCAAFKTLNHLNTGDANTTIVTSLVIHGRNFLKSPWGTMIRIQLLVVLAATNLLFLIVFGFRRHRSKGFITQKGALAAYTLSSSLISYTLGSMQSSAVKSNMYPVWALSLYILLGSVGSATAFSLTDNNKSSKLVYTFTLDLIYAVLITITIPSLPAYYVISCLVLLATVIFFQRLSAAKMATASWNLNKIVADYMEKEHGCGTPYNPCGMKGYRYLVDWSLQDIKLQDNGVSYGAPLTKDEDTRIIVIEKVWEVNDGSLSSDLKDTCLSFSLFHLLRRRFFGFDCAESSLPKTHDFVFNGLLLDHNRAFKVIEVELAFMYDFFFTKYAVLYYRPHCAIFLDFFTVMFMQVITFLGPSIMAFKSDTIDDTVLCMTSYSPSMSIINMAITMIIPGFIMCHQMAQWLFYMRSIWGRVKLACQYVERQASNKRIRSHPKNTKLIDTVDKIFSRGSNWRHKLDQYSLLESTGYNPIPAICNPIAIMVHNFCRKFAVNPIPDKVQMLCRKWAVAVNGFLLFRVMAAFRPAGLHRGRFVRRPGKPVEFSVEVKKAIVQSLHRTKGDLTNGESALVSNGARHLLWSLRLQLHKKPVSGIHNSLRTENQTSIILIWHIATCYCEMAASRYLCPVVGTELKAHLDVATALSKYCAYLVVSAPRLLPGHHFDTTVVFDVTAAEASDFLGHAQDKYECMRSSQEATRGTLFHSGVKLGKQLEELEECARWKVLAEFWAEMLLYLAPSDNVNEHIEHLANGGELITHLWALLTHAGILHRGPRNNVANDIENPGEAASSNRDSCLSTTTTTTRMQLPLATQISRPPLGNPTVQVTQRDVGDRRDSGTGQQDPRELPYGAALSLRHASSYLDKCAEAVGMMVHQPANLVQNVEGACNDGSKGLSDIEDNA